MSIEERLSVLESIVTKDEIVLTDAENPNEKIRLNFKNGEFNLIKTVTTEVNTTVPLINIETE